MSAVRPTVFTLCALASLLAWVQGELMNDREFYWCIRHSRVESGDEMCPGRYRLGPYESADDAELALERVRMRNEEWDAEDAIWRGH